MREPTRRITLLTDFGTSDGYAAAMHGVLADRAPSVPVIDATHDIPPGDVIAGAAALARYWDVFPAGTVHVGVVDPGVGGQRRAIVLESDGRIGVAPDNGLLEPMLARAGECRRIANPDLYRDPVSNTFHGRDIFAPVAAYLAAGGLIDRVGPLLDDPFRLPTPPVVLAGGTIDGSIVHIDHFGNLVTNIPADRVRAGSIAWHRDRDLGPLRTTYADVEPGEIVVLVGSSGFVEISARDASAAAILDIERGAKIRLAER
jgi:S-adenosyl-L-methionine hydrolase (adenosine-forming)